MTQSGQGEEPSARPAREGIVLPSDGGEPLLPGMTGGPAGAPSGHSDASSGAPAGGQMWGQPWGPGEQAPPDQGWQSPHPAQGGQWTDPEQQQAWNGGQPSGAQGPGALPPENAPHPYGAGQPGGPYGTDPYGMPGGGAPLPAQDTGHAEGYGPLPPAADAYGNPAGAGGQAYGSAGGYGGAGAPLPPAGAGGHQGPVPDEGATQYLPPVPADGSAAATQYLPPVPPAAGEAATQYIPPVTSGALPPERPGAQDPEATRYLGTGPQAAGMPPAPGPDAEATQYIPPVPGGGEKQPPADFGHLFRGDGGQEPSGATQQMPRIEASTPPPPRGGQPSRAAAAPGRSRGGRTGSRVPLIAAVGVGIAVLGIGAGALLAGGGGGDDDGSDGKTVAASAPAEDKESASPSADPARAQAVELDKLLADSGDSRSTVINAVADVKRCDNLAQAARDLREAAKQRNQLVTRLGGIEVGRLPEHAALTDALTKAWRASASADDHYAAWADQTAGKKGCKKGQARVTGQTAAGNRASGVASAQKTKAAELWNAIAREYGLTQRGPTQL
ncbi:hypothetical protein ACFV28_03600 [Streptomyces sp. NPDC059720]|uniref:hypothetical protein n=1 Tax=Streptomyces sp. NPDC059720 TaxID=3346924 RepID=UPI0036BA6998